MSVESLDDVPEKPGRSLGVKIALGAGAFFGLVLATAGGFWTYHTFLLTPEAPPPVVVRRVVPTPRPESKPVATITPTPAPVPVKDAVADAAKQVEDTAAQAAALPGKLIAKAQSAMEAKRQAGQEQLDAVAAGNYAATAKPAVVVASKTTSSRQPTPTPTPTPSPTPTPDPKAASTGSETRYAGDIDFSPGASDEFKRFVSEANISAVLQGTPARAMINNRRVRSGEFADAKAGFIFDRLDPARRLIYFKDRLGAVVVRRY